MKTPTGGPVRVSPADLGIGRLFGHIRDAVIVGDASTGRIVLWNPAAEALFGYSAEEAVGLSIEVLVPDPLQGRHRAGLATYGETGHGPLIDGGAPIELPARRRTGEEVWIELSLSPIEANGVAGRFVLAIVRDATSRKQAEAEHLERLRAEAGRAEAERRARLATFRADVGRALTQTGPMAEALGRTAAASVRHLDAAFAGIWTLEESAPVLELQASAGLNTHLDGGHSRVPVGQHWVGLIAQERRPHVTNDVLHDPRVSDKEWARRAGMIAFAGYPLLVEDHVVGVLAMFAGHPLEPDTLDELGGVVDGVAQYIERKRAEVELRQAYVLLERQVVESTARLATLLDVGRELASTHDLHPLLASLLERLQRVVDNDGAAILLQEGEDLCYAAVAGPDRWGETQRIRYPLQAFGDAWERLRRDEPIIVGDVRDDSADARIFRALAAGETELDFIRSLLWVPLVVKGRIIGLLSITRSVPQAFTPRDGELALAIARQAAVAIENARLHERVREAAVLEERQRLARELHDSAIQSIYSLKLYAEAADRHLAAGDTQTAREHLHEMRAAAREALGEMRLLLFEMHPPRFEGGSLAAALRARLSAVEERSGLTANARLDDVRLAESVEQEVYRIAQEALNNALRHARASQVSIVLEQIDGAVRLEVTDDGVGFDSAVLSSGLGLRGIRERADSIGGVLRVQSAPGRGTCVSLEVPR